MDLYIERENGVITLDEWLNCVSSDKELELSEDGTVVNPITKMPFKLKIRGRAIWRGSVEFTYVKGKIGCEGGSAEVINKLKQIAAALNAAVFDCGEKIYP